MFMQIPVEQLQVSELNVRKLSLLGLKELAANIKEVATKFKNCGLIHPLTVRKEGKVYKIVSGQRRFKAIEMINENENIIDQVDCMVIKGSKDRDVLLSLSENVFSQTMDDLERFNAYKLLLSKGYSVNKIASAFGTSVMKVNQALAIANLHDDVIVLFKEEKLKVNVLRHLTNFSHENQLKVCKAITEDDAWFYDADDVNDFLDKTQIDIKYALFDIDQSDLVVYHDLFNDKHFITEPQKFLQLQTEVINEKIKSLQDDGVFCIFDLEYDNPRVQYYERRYESLDDAKIALKEFIDGGDVDPTQKVVYQAILDNDGEVKENYFMTNDDALIRHGCIEKPDTGDSSDGDESIESKKPERQELTKKAQEYYANWQHSMAIHALSQNQSYAIRFLLAKMVMSSEIKITHASLSNKQNDDQYTQSKHMTYLSELFEKYTAVDISLDHPWRHDFNDVLELVMKLTDDEVQEVFSILCVLSIRVGSSEVQKIAKDLEVKPGDYWQADQHFVNNVTSSTALDGIASEVIENQDTLNAFKNKLVKDKKASLLAKLPKSFVPKYLNFPPERYGDTELDIQRFF